MTSTNSGGLWSREEAMKSFIVACVAIIVIAIGAAIALDRYQQAADVAFAAADSVRI